MIYLVDGSLLSTVGLSLYIRFLLEFVQLFDIGLLIISYNMAPMAIPPMYQQHILHCMSLSIAYHSRCVLDWLYLLRVLAGVSNNNELLH